MIKHKDGTDNYNAASTDYGGLLYGFSEKNETIDASLAASTPEQTNVEHADLFMIISLFLMCIDHFHYIGSLQFKHLVMDSSIQQAFFPHFKAI